MRGDRVPFNEAPSNVNAGDNATEASLSDSRLPRLRDRSRHIYPEPGFQVKGSERAVDAAEKESITGLYQEAEVKCKSVHDTLPADVWDFIVRLSRSHKLPGMDDVFVSLRNPYLTVAGCLALLMCVPFEIKSF